MKISCGSGAPLTVATETGYVDGPLTWSANGSQLAWWDGSEVTVASFGGRNGATTRRWACPTCTGAGFLGERAVAVATPSVGYPPRTQLLEYPLSGSGPPAARMVTGLPPAPADQSQVAYGARMLGSLPTGGIVVELVAANQLYTPAELFYRINSAGHATKYGTGRAGSGTLRGIGALAINAAGTELAFTADSGCPNYHHGDQGINVPSLLNPAAGTVTTPPTPAAGGGTFGYWVEGMWFDSSGTPHASLLKNLSDCASSGPLWPPGAAPADCVLAGGRWVKTGSGVLQAQYGPGRWVAETRGTPATGGPEAFPLTISDGSSVRATVSDVSVFAWAP